MKKPIQRRPPVETPNKPVLTLVDDEEDAQQAKEPKVGRNDLCPCGSGKKYKRCCGRNEHAGPQN